MPTDGALVAAQSELIEIATRTLSAYHLTGEDADHAVRMLRSVVHGFATLERDGGFGSSLNLNENFRRLLQIFIAGLRQPTVTAAQEHATTDGQAWASAWHKSFCGACGH